MSKIINEGGINGTGEGVVNINSQDYKYLQEVVQKHAEKQTFEQKVGYALVSLKLQMEAYIALQNPQKVLPVGGFLKEYIKAIKVKNKTFANYIELEEANLSMILKGKRKINTELAFKLGQIFNVHPNYWLLIQSKNELLRFEQAQRMKMKKYKLTDLLPKAG